MKIMIANFTKLVADSGGLAKVTCSFANAMVARGHAVDIVFSDEREGVFFYPLDDRVRTYDLRLQNGERVSFPLYLKAKRELFRAIDKKRGRTINNDFFEQFLLTELKRILGIIEPDIIISFQPASSKALLCDIKTEIPVITMSHGDPADYFLFYPDAEIPSLAKSAVCQVLLPSFEEYITQRIPNCKTITIGNAVNQFNRPVDLNVEKELYKILFVGRLNRNHKRPHLLVEAFSKVVQEFPNWQVEIWGAKDRAEYCKQLETLIKKKNLQDRVLLQGLSKNVPSALESGDIYVIPSAYEGFGLSLAEAMSTGLPVIGYKSCSAVNELIIDGENGFLCEDDVNDLVDKLKQLMSDKALRVRMGKQAHESVKQYAPAKIWDKWEQLMQDVVEGKH